MSELRYFLLELDHRSGDLVVSEYGENEEATAALHERESRREPEVEVVLFMAHSLDDLKRTHSRFFKSLKELVKDFQSAVGAEATGDD